jgi:two-component system sensor histidine kinase RegB
MTALTAQTASSARTTARATGLFGRPVEGGDEGRPSIAWLLQLHWWAILGQLLVIGVAEALSEIQLPITPLVTLLVLEVLGNVVLGAWARRAHVSHAVVAAVMLVDAAVLTVLLDLTGGASNPFSTLYLVNVALAAILLPPRWVAALVAASLLGFASLFFHEQATAPAHHVHLGMTPAQAMSSHLRGMWVAFALAAGFIVYFVRRVIGVLAEREAELQQARALVQRREKLASLATLAAGAAHELSTPLSTIAVVAKELQRALGSGTSEEVRTDLQLVREQVARCREILDRMSANAGEAAGEPMARLTIPAWVEAALEPFPMRDRVTVEMGPGAAEAAIVGPPRALADTLRGLLKNAVQASGPGLGVTLRCAAAGGRVRVTVIDQGKGMPADVLARVGEPFFTTKVPGEGMGLGLFLTRTLAEQLGGDLELTSRPGIGTEASIELPALEAGERSNP